jgi:hypothetical protein
VSGVRTAFREAFQKYDRTYEYLQELLANDSIARSDLYRLFVKINYRILNQDGFEVSGGERSEFRLLQEIADAQNYDILLIDEPESSFDNLFVNSTVGASVGADYVLYATKEIENGKALYRIYSGYPTDKALRSTDEKAIDSHDVMMDSLEAGVVAYESRRQGYEAIKS